MEDNEVEMWKIKNIIKLLNSAEGAGTSMISLIISHKDAISKYTKLLTEEVGAASNIKSRVNRLSVLAAISSAQQKLKLYNKTPKNGLIIFCGLALINGKEKKINIDFEPYKPVTSSLYVCDDMFHTESLTALTEANEIYGFIIMDGNGCMFATLSGDNKTVLQEFTVTLPNKHNKGGQSSVRFERLHMVKSKNYLTKCSELCTNHFIDTKTNLPNISGIILAGHAEFKSELVSVIDERLKTRVKGILDIAYGSQNGFNQAIELSKDILKNVEFVKEKELLHTFFSLISMNTQRYVYGIKDTICALESGAIETLIVYEDLNIYRSEKDGVISYTENGTVLLTEWIYENYKKYGSVLKFITGSSQEGVQFVQGFGGIGGILRYALVSECDGENSDDEYEYLF